MKSTDVSDVVNTCIQTASLAKYFCFTFIEKIEYNHLSRRSSASVYNRRQ